MSDSCSTMEHLVEIGFQRRRGQDGEECVGFRFGALDLDAVHGKAKNGNYPVFLSGVLWTNPTVSIIRSLLPSDLDSASTAAAWVSYALRAFRSELAPLPGWFVAGELHWDLVPPARRQREARERERVFKSDDICYVDREYARLLRRNLTEELSKMDGEAEMLFSFDGRILSIALGDRVHEVVAAGSRWPSSYQGIVSPQTRLESRFTRPEVTVLVFKTSAGYFELLFGGNFLGPCKAVSWNASLPCSGR